jgi:hypothetical protein
MCEKDDGQRGDLPIDGRMVSPSQRTVSKWPASLAQQRGYERVRKE